MSLTYCEQHAHDAPHTSLDFGDDVLNCPMCALTQQTQRALTAESKLDTALAALREIYGDHDGHLPMTVEMRIAHDALEVLNDA